MGPNSYCWYSRSAAIFFFLSIITKNALARFLCTTVYLTLNPNILCVQVQWKKNANFLRCVLLSNKDGFFSTKPFPPFFVHFVLWLLSFFSFLVYFRKSCWLEFCGVKLVGVEKLILSLKKFQVFFGKVVDFFFCFQS